MTGRDGGDVLDGILDQLLVVAIETREAIARCFVKSDPEFGLRGGIHDRLVQILHRFNEVALPENNVAVPRDGEWNRFDLHVLTIVYEAARRR